MSETGREIVYQQISGTRYAIDGVVAELRKYMCNTEKTGLDTLLENTSGRVEYCTFLGGELTPEEIQKIINDLLRIDEKEQ